MFDKCGYFDFDIVNDGDDTRSTSTFLIPKFYGNLVYKFKKIVNTYWFSVQFIVKRRLVIILMDCDRMHVWWSNQSRLTLLLSSLTARQIVGPQTL